LKTPDIAVSSDGYVHVAWFDTDLDQVKTVYSADNGASWNTGATITVEDGTVAGDPVLATTGDHVHLAFKDKSGGAWAVKYRRLAKTTHAIDQPISHSAVLLTGFDNEVSNPAIAASGNNVYVAWANQSTTNTQLYALVGRLNTNNGASADWQAGYTDIPGNTVLNPGTPTGKASHDGVTPPVEDSLRPSLAVTGGNLFAIVWQERGDVECNPEGGPAGPHVPRIFFATPSDTWATAGTMAASQGESATAFYVIDPDLALDSNGTHIVFMKASDDGTCVGGSLGGYSVVYRGPFTERIDGGGVYLPIVIK
jgi:hypothetical protein